MADEAGTTVVLVHGRGAKPSEPELARLWKEALKLGFGNLGKARRGALKAARREFVYYGDLTGAYLASRGETYDEVLDLADREATLQRLAKLGVDEFESRGRYERLPGKSSIGEFLADVGLPVARLVGAAEKVIGRFAPDYLGYWDAQSGIREQAVQRFQAAVEGADARGDRLIVVAHCLGSVVAYDALWSLCHEPPEWFDGRKVELFVTLGSPLGDESVKKKLLGVEQGLGRRYPTNIIRWLNVTAEDDYISHDNTVHNDFEKMLSQHLISSIEDEPILNMAVRFDKSNPHCSLGYLAHPLVARALADAILGKARRDSA